jgi:hypothetical protein
MWCIGCTVIVVSYFRMVPVWLTWGGFLVAGATTVIPVVQDRSRRPPTV